MGTPLSAYAKYLPSLSLTLDLPSSSSDVDDDDEDDEEEDEDESVISVGARAGFLVWLANPRQPKNMNTALLKTIS